MSGTALGWLVGSGAACLLAIALIALEVPLLLWLAARHPRLGKPSALVANGLSGVCLLLALRAALVGSGAGAVALWMALGFLAHLGDLAFRLRR